MGDEHVAIQPAVRDVFQSSSLGPQLLACYFGGPEYAIRSCMSFENSILYAILPIISLGANQALRCGTCTHFVRSGHKTRLTQIVLTMIQKYAIFVLMRCHRTTIATTLSRCYTKSACASHMPCVIHKRFRLVPRTQTHFCIPY
jgi:hypothetical protein